MSQSIFPCDVDIITPHSLKHTHTHEVPVGEQPAAKQGINTVLTRSPPITPPAAAVFLLRDVVTLVIHDWL